MQLSPDTLITRSPGPVETVVGDEVILMSLESGYCIGLGETGSDVWRQLAQPIRFGALITSLREIYQAPESVLEGDVEELLLDLSTRHLIQLT